MKSNYEERKQNRLEAFQNLAAKNDQESASKFNHSKTLGDQIPFGQPILVGHHSEKKHRNHIKKIHSAMDQAVKASEKAAYYAGRAESLLKNTAVSSDDPNAIDKLQEKLERLEAKQDLFKDINKIIRKSKLSQDERVKEMVEQLGLKEETAKKLFVKDCFGGIGIASYEITNNGATIRKTKERIEILQKRQAIESSEETINGARLVISQEDNRVQIFFDHKPGEEIRKAIKERGFHWSYSLECWMRMISNRAIYEAKSFLNSELYTNSIK